MFSHGLVGLGLIVTAAMRPCCMCCGEFERQISEQDAIATVGRAGEVDAAKVQAVARELRAKGTEASVGVKQADAEFVAPVPALGGLVDGPTLSKMPDYGVNRSGRRFAIRP